MRRFALCSMALTLVCFTSIALAGDASFKLNGENTKIEFLGTKPGGKHTGGFKKVTGTATAKAGDPTSLKIAVDIDMTSTYSDNPMLTGHLMSPDFFGVKSNPTSKFVSEKIEKKGDEYVIKGSLTLNGKTAPVAIPAKIAVSGAALDVTGAVKINRNDWGISYGPGKVDNDVSLTVKVAAK